MSRLVSTRAESVLNLVTAVAAVLAVSIVGWREFRSPSLPPSMAGATAQPLSADQLDRLRRFARSEKTATAGLTVAVFSDVQCPFCASLGASLDSLENARPSELAYSVVHFPLSTHPHARGGATALECALDQGRMRQLLTLLYVRQTEIGSLGWREFARLAEVKDLSRFDRCIASSEKDGIVDGGLALGKELGLRGTPMVVIEGYVLGQPPRMADLLRVLDSRRSGASVEMALAEGGFTVPDP